MSKKKAHKSVGGIALFLILIFSGMLSVSLPTWPPYLAVALIIVVFTIPKFMLAVALFRIRSWEPRPPPIITILFLLFISIPLILYIFVDLIVMGEAYTVIERQQLSIPGQVFTGVPAEALWMFFFMNFTLILYGLALSRLARTLRPSPLVETTAD